MGIKCSLKGCLFVEKLLFALCFESYHNIQNSVMAIEHLALF